MVSSHIVLKFVFFVELLIDYWPVKFQCCRLFFPSFMDKFKKHNDDVIMTSSHVVGI